MGLFSMKKKKRKPAGNTEIRRSKGKKKNHRMLDAIEKNTRTTEMLLEEIKALSDKIGSNIAEEKDDIEEKAN